MTGYIVNNEHDKQENASCFTVQTSIFGAPFPS